MIFSKQNRRFFRACVLALAMMTAATGLSGCATLDTMLGWVGFGEGSTPETPEALAMEGMNDFNRGKYSAALKRFVEIKDRFPFSEVALLAELKAADSNYHMEKFSEAKTLYEEFEANHPTNEAVPYVLFQIGMCYYGQIGTYDRDPGSAMNAVQAFGRLNRSYPQSPYFVEASARIRAARDFLAQHEFYVATFYVRSDEDKQAQGRLEYLLANFPEASIKPQATDLLAQLKSGKGVEKTWRRFVPTVSLPDWQSFSSAFGILPGGSGSGSGAPKE
ncbi:MAG: outer membrane protein assembly factor BamD [Desulfurivibrio sp.]|nr:outer membrane protein assembly factor BamD [Desulfurivibrio sp.]MBU3937087.1 outer membrane protein assembly factor BamD [Pseudomonadota bacterium]MBU4117917.1 outer membrane protein assembly factor BamD [Pseudomonadota bacterium]